jgi:hypothetical protein
MVGLHYTFYDIWGVNTESAHYKEMEKAIAKKYYRILKYEDIEEEVEKYRVKIQEFAYWVITSFWDI